MSKRILSAKDAAAITPSATPWVGWSFPVPTPVMLAAAIVVAAVLTRGGAS